MKDWFSILGQKYANLQPNHASKISADQIVQKDFPANQTVYKTPPGPVVNAAGKSSFGTFAGRADSQPIAPHMQPQSLNMPENLPALDYAANLTPDMQQALRMLDDAFGHYQNVDYLAGQAAQPTQNLNSQDKVIPWGGPVTNGLSVLMQ